MKTHTTTIVLAAVLALFVAAPSTEAAASTDPDARGAKKNVRVRRQARQAGDRAILQEAAPRPQHPNERRAKMSKIGQHAFDDDEGDSNEYVPLKSNDLATYMLTAEDANGGEALGTSQFGEMSMANLDDEGSSSAEEDGIEVDAEMGIGLELPLDSAPLAEAALSMPLLEEAALSMPLEESAFSMPLEGVQAQDTEFGVVAVSDSKPSGPAKNEHAGPSGKADKDAETPAKTEKPEDSKKPKGPKGKGGEGGDEAPVEEGGAEPIDETVSQFITNAGDSKSSALVASVVGALVLMW